MKTRIGTILALLAITATIQAQQVAFPGAEGWGRFATGGRTGKVYHVTNLNDSGTGSLRDAVSQSNRIIVFDVAGVIRLQSRLAFKNNLTICGQTAPGEGITVYGDGVSFTGSNNIIVRYMRFRMGAVGTKGKDCAGIARGENMIFDHCSFSWGQDENFSINWDGNGTAPQNITLQNSIVGQGLMTHSAGGLMQADNITIYRTLLVDNSTRNFKVKGRNQYVNNMVYNWKNAAYNMGGDSEGESFCNIESNLFVNGPAGGGNCLTGGNGNFHFYGADNWQDGNGNGLFDPEEFTGNGGGDRQAKPYAYPALEKWDATELVERLLPDVGASLPYRDLADCYMIDEVLSFGTEGKLITNEKDLPIGTPEQWVWYKGEKKNDTDGDGMPDEWETSNGCDPTTDDAMVIGSDGYANIEQYVNSISRESRQYFLRAPMLLKLASATTNSLTLQWADYSDNEDGFVVEMEKDGQWTVVGRTAANEHRFTIDDQELTPATAYQVRLCATSDGKQSDYTPALTVKTRPEQVDIIDVETFTGEGDGEWLINPLTDETITLTEPTSKTAVVVYSDADVTINGQGYLYGPASLNKAGKGTLVVATDQQYEGATVLHDGIYEFSTLKDGGVACGLGKSQEFAQNWVMDGGTFRYTGGSTSTDRSAQIYSSGTLEITSPSATITMNGSIEGQGDLTIGGEGTININNASFFRFDGRLLIEGGTICLNNEEVAKAGIGTASSLILSGGCLKTNSGNDKNPKYTFPIETVAGTTSRVSFYRNCEIANNVSGGGNMEWEVNWVREYISGDWSEFTGCVIVNGTGKAGESQFAMSKDETWEGIPNGTLYLKGTAQVMGVKNQSTRTIGGLSGEKGTFLSGFDVKNAGSGTWVVGTANTHETFHGVIDDRSQGGKNGKTSIEKKGDGSWRLTGKNVYNGTTYVTQGTLIVNGQHTGTGAITVRKGATLAGTGKLAGKVTVNVGGTLMVGDTLATDHGLTFNGGLKINNGAILSLNEEQAERMWNIGDEIKVFTATDVTGEFAEIIPAIPGEGMEWDISKLYTTGILTVKGIETGIQSTVMQPRHNNIEYNLDGRAVQTGEKGIHILNGRKIIKR